MDKLTKQQIKSMILTSAKTSIILKNKKNMDAKWTINELIYCLERIQKDNNNLNFSICPETGSCIPVDVGRPVWVESVTRARIVKIQDIEIEEYEENIFYLIIVKEIQDV